MNIQLGKKRDKNGSSVLLIPYVHVRGCDSLVGIETCYGLDDPEIKSRWGARFSIPVQTGPLGPN